MDVLSLQVEQLKHRARLRGETSEVPVRLFLFVILLLVIVIVVVRVRVVFV